MIVGKIVEALAAEEGIGTGGSRLHLGFHADADDGGRDLLDDVAEARRLLRLDADGLSHHRGRTGGDGAEADRRGDGDRSGPGHETLAGTGLEWSFHVCPVLSGSNAF